VSSTLPGADVRGFYAALRIELPGWAQQEASVRCFANPDAHGDRDPSCSVNVETDPRTDHPTRRRRRRPHVSRGHSPARATH
jgi:hypothetical protein